MRNAHKFRFITCQSLAELDRYGIREFAAEFGHKPIGLPVVAWFCDDDLVAYVEVRRTSILYPAVHPKVTPRIFLEGGRLLAKLVEGRFAGGFVIYDYRSALFGPEAMESLGFTLSPLAFFEVPEPDLQLSRINDHGSQSAIYP